MESFVSVPVDVSCKRSLTTFFAAEELLYVTPIVLAKGTVIAENSFGFALCMSAAPAARYSSPQLGKVAQLVEGALNIFWAKTTR